MNNVLAKLAAIKPQGKGDFAYEIYSGLLSDSNNQFYCADLIEGLKVVSDKEQEFLSSGDYDPDDENLLGYYVINNREFYFDDLAYELRNVNTDKKIIPDTWGPGYQVIA